MMEVFFGLLLLFSGYVFGLVHGTVRSIVDRKELARQLRLLNKYEGNKDSAQKCVVDIINFLDSEPK